MWLGISDSEEERNKRRRRIELSGECMGLECPRFQAFLDDTHTGPSEGRTFDLGVDAHREIARINTIEDEGEMLRAYLDFFRGIGKCPIYMLTKNPAGFVREHIAPGDCAQLDAQNAAKLPLE